jgi:hypothetical protein
MFYSSNGPTESRRKTNEFSSVSSTSPLTHYSWLPTSSNISSPDESPHSYFSSIINDQFNGITQLKNHQTIPPPQQQHSFPKTICRHCKSHNMPECLYTCKLNSIFYLNSFIL